MNVRSYTVSEAFSILRENKLTTNEESVRRWLRQGIIQGIPPETRKEGWRIREDDLYMFIQSRLPENFVTNLSYPTNDAKNQEAIRAEMWWELARKHIFEGFIEPKRKQIKACAEHKRYSRPFEKEAWSIISKHKMGYVNPHIPYLLDAFLFNGQRIRMDDHYELQEERMLYALLEHIRKKKSKGDDYYEDANGRSLVWEAGNSV